MAALRMVVISNARWRADICSEGVSLMGFMGCNGHLNDPEIMNQIFRDGGSRRATEGNRMKFFGLVLALTVTVGRVGAEVQTSRVGVTDSGNQCHRRSLARGCTKTTQIFKC